MNAMIRIAHNGLTQARRTVSVLLIISLLVFGIKLSYVQAADLTSRSIQVGSPIASDVTSHTLSFSTATSTSVGSIVFEYCSNLPFYGSPCTAPTGLVVNASSIGAQSGITGLSISALNSTINRLVLTRTPSVVAPTNASVRLNNVTNQSTPSQSVFVRISVLNATDGTGTPIDYGAVVYTTTVGIGVGGYVPPYLTFCVGVIVATDCSSTTGSLMTFGELSKQSPNTTTSQFAVATNDPTGYNTYISGGTMTAGNEVIPALSANGGSAAGTSQFGINLRSNSSPSAGGDVSGIGTGIPAAGYNIPNSFRYNDGERIAFSSLPTHFNRFTVTYLVNVSEEQRPGIYASSYTFTAIASF